MPVFRSKLTAIAIGLPSILMFTPALSSRNAGVESGNNSVPANCSSALPSCSSCHSNSAPSSTRTNGPTTSLTAAKHALNISETISVTTAVTGGVVSTTGGFICEATGGTFTAGTNSRIISNSSSITHSSNVARSWTYSYTAPTTSGLYGLTAAGMSSSGSGSSSDRFAFSGYDSNSLTATPTRLFVLPANVTNVADSCPDGYGNYSVLGANGSPVIGNTTFSCDLYGATPSSVAVLWLGLNPVGFTAVDLGPVLGWTGCSLTVASPMVVLNASTTSGVAERAEGTASFVTGIPNNPLFHGIVVNAQAVYLDPSAAGVRGESLSLSNGLTITIP